MKYAVDMGSGATIYVPSVIKIGSGIQKLIRGNSQTRRQHGDLVILRVVFHSKENRLKILR
jgi:hypothetical protein